LFIAFYRCDIQTYTGLNVPFSNQFNLELKVNTLLFPDRFLYELDQCQDVIRLGIGVIDKEVSMQRADLRVANTGALQTGGFDQSSGVIAWWVLNCSIFTVTSSRVEFDRRSSAARTIASSSSRFRILVR
jgi:hypothetical protein